jgi:hypothetical protein
VQPVNCLQHARGANTWLCDCPLTLSWSTFINPRLFHDTESNRYLPIIYLTTRVMMEWLENNDMQNVKNCFSPFASSERDKHEKAPVRSVVNKWHWPRYFSQYFGSLPSVTIPPMLHNHYFIHHSMGTGVLSIGKRLITHLHLVARLRMNGVIPPFPLHIFTVWAQTI